MWIVWTITIPIWLIFIVLLMAYAAFDAYGKFVLGIIDLAFFVMFLGSILAIVFSILSIHWGKKEKYYNAWEDIKTIFEFGIYAFIYGMWFMNNYIIPHIRG